MLIVIGVMFILIVIGVFLYNGKGAFLIAGYNTMPEEEREKYDVKALCKFAGKSMFVIAFTLSFSLIGIIYDLEWPFHLSAISGIVYVLFMVIYMNTGNRFKKEDGK